MPAYADIIPTHEHSQSDASNLIHKGNIVVQANKEDVVISGMSGRFPESSSVKEFEKNLYEGIDMITDDDRRWTPGLYGLPKRSGKLKKLNEFDAAFFNVAPKQAHCMDPQLRMLLEVTGEAIFDSGIHPNNLRGKSIGVYVGASVSESEQFFLEDPDKITGYELTGCCRAMFANRVSYSFDFKGPSYAVDTACSSSLVAFHAAWKAITDGEIEGAIVAGTQLCLKPHVALQFNSLNMLSSDGCCKSFDSDGKGYVRSEAVAAIFLQRSQDAKRVYANVVQALVNTDGNKDKGITFPSSEIQSKLLREVYKKAGIDPADVSYLESHGTGTKAGDPQEIKAITEVFCRNRTEPLLIGSVKSNMGHAEPASGVCSIIKVLLAIKNQEIPANLHFNEPNPDLTAIVDGRLKVVSTNTPLKGRLVGINSFGFGGANAHIILKSPNYLMSLEPERFLLMQNKHIIKEGEFPRLIVCSGRNEETVQDTLREFQRSKDANFASLIDNIADTDSSPTSYPYRGFTLVGGNSNVEVFSVSETPIERTPLWLIFSGMGSQWTCCGSRFMGIPPFAAVIQKCRGALLPFGIDVLDIITQKYPDPMLSTTASFTAIAAVQVGLIDTLRAVGLNNFDGYIGHSVGELGCGYVDGTLTAEQTVLAAYWRGRAVEEADLPEGGMAAVGLSVAEAEKWCKDHGSACVVACHNSASSITLSGPKDEVLLLKQKFDAEGIFCREVNSGGIAFHHPSLRKAAPRLLAELQKFILQPLKRSSKWISSSFPEHKWNTGIAKKASAEYLVNNLVSPVLFAEALLKIPENARVIEVSPHALMQAVLRRALPTCTQFPLVRKEATDSLIHLLQGLGKLYVSGERLHLSALYPSNSAPVPLSTPSIASCVSWDHNIDWQVATFKNSGSKEFIVEVNLSQEEYAYLDGHNIDGRILYPATGYLVLVWKALGKLVDMQWDSMSITFDDIVLHQATVMSSTNPVKFTVRILLKKGEFEVLAGDGVAASGKIHIGSKESPEREAIQRIIGNINVSDDLGLEASEVYKELKLRGYHYKHIFQGIVNADLKGTYGQLKWQRNWVSFLDTMLQFSLLGSSIKGLYLPTRIRKVIIEPAKLVNNVTVLEDMETVQIRHNSTIGITVCPGIEIHGLKATMAPRRAPSDDPVLEHYSFIPNMLTNKHKLPLDLDNQTLIAVLMNLMIENSSALKIKIAHQHLISDHSKDNQVLSYNEVMAAICKSFKTQLSIVFAYSLMSESEKISDEEKQTVESSGVEFVKDFSFDLLSKLNLFIMTNSSSKISDFIESLGPHTSILVDSVEARNSLMNKNFIEFGSVEKLNLYLLKKASNETERDVIVISDKDKEFEWVDILKQKISSVNGQSLWLVSRKESLTGLLGLFKCLRRENSGIKLRCVIDPDDHAALGTKLWEKIINSDLVINIVKDGVLGTMAHIPLPKLDAKPAKHSYLNVLTRGDLASLTWITATVPKPDESKNTILCSVKYAPLNFRDIMLASGKLPPDALPGNLAQRDCILGLEFAGVAEDGSRVMGLVAAGGLATTVRADSLLTWNVPEEWSLEEASSVPVVYATAYYALVMRGNLQSGESLLIHAGSGGVGQAAISIALSRGCTVYTTVSSTKKRDFLKERFPQLKDDNFANSRDSTFEYHIMEQTKGQGVDLVLNSLAGELLQASVRSLKEHGRFLEIGKADLANNSALGMSIFLKNITFHGILLDALMEGSDCKKLELQNILYKGIDIGEVKPIPFSSFKYDAVEEAFRFMASGKHIGKVILDIQSAGNSNKIKKGNKKCSKAQGISSIYRLWPMSDLVYIITGGLGGLGLEISDWLIGRGAKRIVLTSRRGITTGYQALCVKRWRALGVSVIISTQDSSTIEGAEKLICDSAIEAPIGGIFHLAAVLLDGFFDNQTIDNFKSVIKTKGDGAIYLDLASRKLCPDLHIWVTFSSVACGRGNPGQSNYAWANCVTEKVVEQRVSAGLPACAIQFSGIGDVGLFVNNIGSDVELMGTKAQSVRSVLACLDQLIGSEIPIVSSMCLVSKEKSGKDAKGAKSLVASIANILGVRDASKLPGNASLGDLGLDSLMAVEIKQTLEREADLIMAPEDIRNLTLNIIQKLENNESSESKGDNSKLAKPSSWLEFPLNPKEITKYLNEDSKHTSAPLFIASPIQGTCEVLSQVASGLNTKVIGLQYPNTIPSTSISKLAEALIQEIETMCPSGPYYLGGYSYGASVAFEVAHQMERKSRKPVSLLLLDGSHSYVSGIIDSYRKKYKGSSNESSDRVVIQGESDALVTFTLQFCAVDALKLREDLLNQASWDLRVKYAAELILSKCIKHYPHLSIEEIALSAKMFFDRLTASFEHDSSRSHISIPTLLIRASQNTHLIDFGKDYGLSKVISGQLTVKECNGTHESFITGDGAKTVASFINEFLEHNKN